MDERTRQALTTKPTSREKISAWITYFLGFHAHQTVRCTHIEGDQPHNSQLDYIESAFLNLHSSCVVMAARNAGKSYAAAIVILLECWFKPGIRCCVAAYQRNQSDFIYTYLIDFIAKFEARIGQRVIAAGGKRALGGNTNAQGHQYGPNGRGGTGKDVITFLNGSSVSFYSGGKSKTGVKGFHPHSLFIDECDLFTAEQFDGLSNALEAGGNFKRRLDILSTNYTVSGDGVVLKQIERYKEFNKTNSDLIAQEILLPTRIFKICLLDILVKCDDRFKCFDEKTKKFCPLWDYCQGKAKEGEGFYKIESAMECMRDSSRQTFESQMMLLRPSSEFAYFHNFDLVKNVCDPDRELDPSMLSFTGWDFGGISNVHACVVMQKSTEGVFYAVDEFTALGSLEGLIGKVLNRYPNACDFDCWADPKFSDVQQIKGGVSYKDVLKRAGFFPRARGIKREPSFMIMFNLIDPASGPVKLRVNKRCKGLLRQIFAAEHKTTTSGKPTTDPADKAEDDLLDGCRYVISNACSSTYARHNGAKRLFFKPW